MVSLNSKVIISILLLINLVSFASAFGLSSGVVDQVNIVNTTQADYWQTSVGNLKNANTSQFDGGDGSNLNILESWLSSFVSGGTSSASWNRSGSNTFLHYTGDNVGIGTSSPASKLEVNGNINVTKWISQQGVLGLDLTDDGSDLTLHGDVGGQNSFTIETDGAFLKLIANPGPANDYLLATLTETQGSNTEFNFYEGGIGHNRFWNSGSARFGGSADYLCSNMTSDVDCDTSGTGADIVVQDDGWFGGNLLVNGSGDNWFIGNVGIGTTSPSASNKLTVGDGSGDDGITILSGSSSGDYGRIWFGDGVGTSAEYQGYIQYDQGDGDLELGTSANTRLLIDSSGNVGIGTSAPTQKLEVFGGSVLINNTGGLGIRQKDDDGAGVAATGYWELVDSADATRWRIGSVSDGNLSVRSNTNDLLLGDSSSATTMVLRGGKVGIGTTNPGGLLGFSAEESTAAKILFDGAIDFSVTTLSQADGGLLGIGANAKIDTDATFDAINSAEPSSLIVMGNYTSSQGILFKTAESGNPSDAMIITSSGNVGIGTSSPGAKLDISAINDAGIILRDSQDSNAIIARIEDSQGGASNEGYLRLYADDTEGVRIRPGSSASWINGGNVGIGTTSPYSDLQISQSSNSWPGGLTLLSQSTNYNWTIHADNDGNLMFGRRGATPLVFNQSGAVGIGTTAPTHTLNVKGTMNVSSDAYIGESIFIDASNNSLNFLNNETIALIRDNGFIVLQGEQTGFTDSPRFEVYGTAHPTNAGDVVIASGGADGDIIFGYDAGSFSTKMIMKSSGNFGIGTSSPNQKLQVNGSVNISGDLWVQGQNMTVPDYVFDKYKNPEKVVTAIDEYEWETQTNEVCNNVTIQEQSQTCVEVEIGINITTNETIYEEQCTDIPLITEIQCFNVTSRTGNILPTKTSEYKLLGLDEVKEYVTANNSLPRVESASDSDTFNVVQRQNTLLEKIEELFIHLFGLDDRVTSLENENQIIKSELCAKDNSYSWCK